MNQLQFKNINFENISKFILYSIFFPISFIYMIVLEREFIKTYLKYFTFFSIFLIILVLTGLIRDYTFNQFNSNIYTPTVQTILELIHKK
jgi:hypothetical protein